ncbi:hypothetical protein BDV96DRAFT_644561 [Lophiotrema nucula]|uniref:Uncharacterized protein n=1 Tax=Lophiotrema nucula TaxID=690887 RepID=A0A6A5ZEH0_9PLEO|nr:hypothetical protein BDV96DRAFT_644561 [Lophiotrema nucula]
MRFTITIAALAAFATASPVAKPNKVALSSPESNKRDPISEVANPESYKREPEVAYPESYKEVEVLVKT